MKNKTTKSRRWAYTRKILLQDADESVRAGGEAIKHGRGDVGRLWIRQAAEMREVAELIDAAREQKRLPADNPVQASGPRGFTGANERG